MSLADTVRKLQKDVSTALRLAMKAGGGGGGEANTASNQGVGGVGLYHSKVGVDLQFKNINAGSSKISVTNDVPNKEVDIDVVIANLAHSHQGAATGGQLDHGLAMTPASLLDDDHTGYLLADGTRALTADWDAGVAAGRIISAGWLAAGPTPATGGRIRLPNAGYIVGRNVANTGNVTIAFVSAADRVVLGDAAAASLCANMAGNFVIGGIAAGNELLTIMGTARVSLGETTDPVATANYGKIWVRSSDSKLYYMDDSGNIYELTAVGTVTSENFMPRWNVRDWAGIKGGSGAWIGVGCSVVAVAPGADSIILDASGRWMQDLSNAIAGNICQVRANNYNSFQPRHNPYGVFCLQTYSDIAHVRLWVGFNTAAPPRAANPNQDDVGFRFSTPDGDTNWMFQSRDAGGTTTVDTGVAVAAATVYLFKLWTSDGGVTWNWDINGTSGSNIANVPSTTAGQSPLVGWIPESAAADAFRVGYFYWLWDQG